MALTVGTSTLIQSSTTAATTSIRSAIAKMPGLAQASTDPVRISIEARKMEYQAAAAAKTKVVVDTTPGPTLISLTYSNPKSAPGVRISAPAPQNEGALASQMAATRAAYAMDQVRTGSPQ